MPKFKNLQLCSNPSLGAHWRVNRNSPVAVYSHVIQPPKMTVRQQTHLSVTDFNKNLILAPSQPATNHEGAVAVASILSVSRPE